VNFIITKKVSLLQHVVKKESTKLHAVAKGLKSVL